MRFIYATGRTFQLQFAISTSRDDIPDDAVVCAICHPHRSIRNLDDWLLGAMTNSEFHRLAMLIRAALELETGQWEAVAHLAENMPLCEAEKPGHQPIELRPFDLSVTIRMDGDSRHRLVL